MKSRRGLKHSLWSPALVDEYTGKRQCLYQTEIPVDTQIMICHMLYLNAHKYMYTHNIRTYYHYLVK